MRSVIILIIVLALAVGAWFAWRAWRAPAAVVAAVVTTQVVERGIIQRSVAATGRVVSNLDVDIKCKASGVVVKLPFDISDMVKRGDLVVQLDPIDEKRAVAKAQATVDASLARLEQAKRNGEIAKANLITATGRARAALMSIEVRVRDARSRAARMTELLKSHLASQEDADTALTTAEQGEADLATARVAIEELKAQELAIALKEQDLRLAETAVVSDQIALDNAQQRLTETTVLAPMDGVVATRTVQIGTIISSGITYVGGGTAALTISDLSRIFVLAAIDESDIGQVRIGQDVRVTADAFAGRRFTGKVVRIATRGVNTSNVVTFEVKLEVLGEERPPSADKKPADSDSAKTEKPPVVSGPPGKILLKPEMTTNVEVIVEFKEDVVVVPAEAITRRKGTALVQVVKEDASVEERSVKTGISDNVSLEIIEGLMAGEKIQVKRNEPASQWRGGNQGPPRMMGMPLGGGGKH